MGLLEDLSTKLAADGVVDQSSSTVGWKLFREFMPDTPDQVVVLTETGGQSPMARIDMDRPSVQVRVRSAVNGGRAAARSKIEDAYGVLHELDGTVGAGTYVGIWAQQTPFFLRTDENGRYEYAVNFRAMRSR